MKIKMCLWWWRQWRRHVTLCSASTSPLKQQRNWWISSKSLPCPDIVVNQKTSSRMSWLGGGRRIVCEETTISMRGNQPLCGWQFSWYGSWESHTSRVEIISSGRNHPTNNGILATHPWGWEVCHWLPRPSSNLHHLSIVHASYHIWWKWSSCKKANTDPLEWLW